MAKEMMIVFVYDTLACQAEADDPIDAVLYFHPSWVSDTQRHALAGQVVGAAHCVRSLLSQPEAITLQSGKFMIREYGRYILAVGSDRNIPDWVLRSRAALLAGMIRVYHGSLTAVAEAAAAAAPEQPGRWLADKLYHMLETYLPLLQYGTHVFQRVPMLTLPKSATSVYMEAMQILEHCRKIRGVLGGVILYNNKIIGSQLPPGLTSYLAVVDPYRIRSPGERVLTATPLPPSAQLLKVHVGAKAYRGLARRAAVVQEFARAPEDVLAGIKKNQEGERDKREFPTGMKRDKSLLFTAVPEEDHNMISPPSNAEHPGASDVTRKPSNIPDVVPFTNRPRQRPTKLSLSFKTQKSVEEDAKENEKVFTGQTSVCSTPMVEYKRLHENVLSICQNPEVQKSEEEPDVLKNIENSAKVEAVEREKRDHKSLMEFNCIGEHYIHKPAPIRKPASVTDIHETIKRLSNRATAKFKLKRPKVREDDPSPERMQKSVSTVTINDPSFPVFRNDGKEISESLFNQYLEHHYASLKQDLSKEDNLFTFNMKQTELQEKFEGFDSELTKSPQRTPKKIAKDSTKTILTDQSRRKSLSLPLKSLSESSDSQIGSDSEAASFKKKLSGVQLTPLMEKLSHLAFSDKSSGYSSRVMTPLELREFPTPATERQVTFSDRPKSERQDSEDESDSDEEIDRLADYCQRSVRCALFVSGLQNMALLALVELSAVDGDVINSLWELSLNALGPIEQKCMEPLQAGHEATDYSYLTLDPEWGTVKKGGPWPPLDIATMGLIHSQFAEDPQLSELILRSDESVVLGTACGGAEVYYAEAGARQPGPPAPSDPLPCAALRAKRRLHADHSLVIL